MSAKQKVRDTIKNTEEFLESTKRSLREEFSKTAPKIEHALDKSLDEAGRALSNALDSIERKTRSEQLELLNGYRSFLQRQIAFVDSRINAVKKTDARS